MTDLPLREPWREPEPRTIDADLPLCPICGGFHVVIGLGCDDDPDDTPLVVEYAVK